MINMAELKNENQAGDGSESTGSERSFGEVQEREVPTDESTDAEASQEETTDEGESTETGDESGETGESTEEGDKPTLTEKGTKLDPNPESAAHQLLANEKRVRGQMEQVLANPDLLAKFMEDQYGVKVTLPSKDGEKTETTTEDPFSKEYKAEDLENLDDVANVINGIQKTFGEKVKGYETKIQQLETAVSSLLQGGQAQHLATKMSEEVGSLRAEPELDPNSSDFIEGLEQDIAEEYHKLDFDTKTGRYRGNYSLKDVGDRMISVARKASKKGSTRAQTIVKDKTEGKVTTSPKVTDAGGEEDSNPSNSIAAGISKLFR